MDKRENNGGAREGAGRKPKVEEEKVRGLAIDAIVEKYGSEQLGFAYLLSSQDNALIKWVFEHAFGKPKEKMEHSGELGIIWQEIKNYGANREANEGS